MPMASDWPGIQAIMASRYYIDWQHNHAHLIRVVRHLPSLDVVGVVTIQPHEKDYLVDCFEVEWENGQATRRGQHAALLVKDFLSAFQKAVQRKLFCLVMLDNKRHEDIIKKRGWKHVANLLEFQNGQD